jgi:hypothetical protein
MSTTMPPLLAAVPPPFTLLLAATASVLVAHWWWWVLVPLGWVAKLVTALTIGRQPVHLCVSVFGVQELGACCELALARVVVVPHHWGKRGGGMCHH